MLTNRQPGALSLARNPMRPMLGMPRFFHDAPGDGGSSGGGGGAPNDPQDPKTDDPPAGTITLTQDQLDEMIERRLNRERTKFQKEIDALKKPAKPEPKDPPQGKPEDKTYTQAELQQLLAQKDEEYKPKLMAAEERVAKLLEKERSAAIIGAAAKANAIDPEDVALLVGRFVAHDEDGNVVVLNERGSNRLNAKGEPMSVEEFVKSFVDSKPHLKRGSNTPGVGSTTDNTRDPKTPMSAAEKIAAGLAKL